MKYMLFSPFFLDWDNKGQDCFFVEFPNYAISIFLAIKIPKNNIDTSRVTNKQYYKTVHL